MRAMNKRWNVSATQFAWLQLLIVPSIVVAVGACAARSASPQDCRVGDMAANISASDSSLLRVSAGSWIHRARQCTAGEYLIVTPAAGVPFESSADDGTQHARISYATQNQGSREWIENVDRDRDGTIDFRSVEDAKGNLKLEHSVISGGWNLFTRARRAVLYSTIS